MAERALLAREREDGSYTLSTARWGGTDRALSAAFDGIDPVAMPDVEWTSAGTAADFSSVVAALDYLSTAVCYRVDRAGTTVLLPLWAGLPLADEAADPDTGALVAVRSLPDARRLRAEFRTLKRALADALVAGDLPAGAAPFVLAAWVESHADRERHLSLAAAEG
jgi:hypothetical protein